MEANEVVGVVAVVRELWNVVDPCLILFATTVDGLETKAWASARALVQRAR